MGLLDSFPTYEKTKKKKNSAKKSSKTSGQKNRVEYRHRDSSKSSKATTKTKKRVSSAKKKAKSSASSSGGRNQVEYRHRDTNASSESSLLSKELPVAKERKENTERDTALTPKMNLPYGNQKKPTTSASSASPKGFGDFRVAQREQEKNQAKPLNLQYLSNEFVNNLLNQGTKRTSDTEKMYHPFDYEKIEEQSAMRREGAKEHREALWRNIKQGARSVQRTLNKNAYSILDSSDEIHGTNGRGPVPLSKQRELNDQARETASNFFEKDAKRNEQIAKDIEEGKISSFTSKVAQGFGQLAAESPFWALGGGLGTVAKGATKAAKVAGKIINSMASPSLPYYITSDYGDHYYQARQEGATREEANKSALLYAIPAAIAERLGGADAAATKAIGQRLGDNIVSSIIKSAASEGLEEAAQTSYGNLTRRTYKDVPLFSTNPEQDAVINPQQMAESAAVGAVLGGFSGGAIHGASNIVNRTSSRADRNDNQGTSADTTAADVGNSNMLVAPEQVNAYIDYAYTYGQSSVLPKQKSYLEIAKPSQRLIDDLQEDFDVSGYTHALRDNDIRHIRNSHGERTNEKYPVTKQDLKQIPDIIENYDDVYYSGSGKTKGIYYMKRHNGVTYYLEQITNNYDNKPLLINKQMIKVPTGTVPKIKRLKEAIEKRNSNHRPAGDVAPTGYTPEALNDTVSINSIPDPAENINYVSAYKNKADQQVPDTPMGPQGDARNELPASAFNNSIPDSAENINPRNEINSNPADGGNGYQLSRKTRGFTESYLNSHLPTEKQRTEIEESIHRGDDAYTYTPKNNNETLANVYDHMDDVGKEKVLSDFIARHEGATNVNAEETTLGMALLADAYNRGDSDTLAKLLPILSQRGTDLGQGIQAYALFNRLTPEGMLLYAQKQIDRRTRETHNFSPNEIIAEVKNQTTRDAQIAKIDEMLQGRMSKTERSFLLKLKRYLKDGEKQNLSDKDRIVNKSDFPFLTEEDISFITSKMEEAQSLPAGREKDILIGQVQGLINNKIDPTLGRQLRGWQRNSLLFNFVTNARNIAGNAVTAPAKALGDIAATPIDIGLSKITGTRTKSLPNPKATAKGVTQGVKDTVSDYRLGIDTSAGNKFDRPRGRTFSNKTIIGRAFNAVDRLTSTALQLGDRPFYQAAFNSSLEGQMRANGATEPTEDMIDIANLEALQNTWQDNNMVSNGAQQIVRTLNGGKEFGFGNLVSAFVKSPANLAKGIFDYSPAGLVANTTNNARRFIKAQREGTMTPQIQHKFVNDLAKGMGGTIVAGTILALAENGLLEITGAPPDDKDEAEYEKNVLGIQPYSIRIGNTYYDYSWMQPLGGVLAAMVEYNSNRKEGEGRAESAWQSLQTFTDSVMEALRIGGNVLTEQSFLQSVYQLFKADDLMTGVIDVIASAPSQFVPTLFFQTVKFIDPTARSTYEPDDITQTILNQITARIPGLSDNLPPVVNSMGNEKQRSSTGNRFINAFFNPFTMSKENAGDMENELQRLYQETGDRSVFPEKVSYSFTYGGEKYTLTAQERSDWQKFIGSEFSAEFSGLINSEIYSTMTDDEKVKAVSNLQSMANAEYKKEYLSQNGISYKIDSEYQKAIDLRNDYDIEPFQFYAVKAKISTIEAQKGSYEGENTYKARKMIDDLDLDGESKIIFANELGQISDEAVSKAQNCYSSTGLSYDDFYTAYMEAQNIEGQIKTRGKQYTGEASDSKRALVMGMSNLGGEQQIALASALGCFSDTQINNAQTALKEANIGLKDYFKVYTEVNQLNNMLESQGISGKERLFQLGKFIAGYDNFTKEQKSVLDNFIVDDSVRMTYDNDIDYTDEWTAALTRRSEKNAALIEPAIALGIPTQQLYVIFTNLNGFEADKDANGKSVSGSLRKKSMAYIDSMPISNEQKNFFFNTVAGYSGSPRWGNINFGKQGKGIASFSESELTVDNEGNPINQPTAETASTTSLTPVQQAIHNMMGSFVEKIHQHPETKAISAAITAANAVSSGLSHTPNTNALQQAIWAPFFARVYGDQAASPQEEQSAFTGVTEDNGRFPAEIINAAMQSQIEDGIPAAITLAQWAQESGYGAHMPANSNNPFGITAGRGWTGKTVQGNNAAGTDPATYRVYDSLADAFKDHAAVLKNGYYDIDGLDVSDVDGWIGALQGVYATDPNYGNALRQIIEDNHLSQYTEMAKQYSASSLSAASAPNTIYSPVDISKINTGYPFGAPKTGGRSGTHKGTDFSVPTGTPVTAVADGIVIKAGSNGSAYGNSVLVDMGNGYYYQYNHLSDWGVKAGDTVKAGDIICKSGNTGSNNTGAHLEIEVYQGSPDYGNQIDPVAYFGWGDAEPGTVIHSTDSGNYQSQGGSSGNGSGGSGSSSGSTSQGRGYSSSGIPYAYDGSLYRSSNYRNSRTSLAGNGGRYSFEGRSLPAYQYMGPRNDLFTGNSPAPTESKGKVVYAAPDNGVNRVVVDNGDGTYTSYRNVGEINVKRGDYADESTILAGTNPDQVEVEIIQGNFLINNNDLQAYSRQLGA